MAGVKFRKITRFVARMAITNYIYYCMTGREIRGNIPFEIDRKARSKGGTILRSRTLCWPTLGIAIIDLLYDFRITIGMGMGNNVASL